MKNIDDKTVKSFGDEWARFDQSDMSDSEAEKIFNEYFSIFPWSSLPNQPVGFDMGCGSGRWAKFAAPRVEKLNCIDPSSAIKVAQRNLSSLKNISFEQASVDSSLMLANSQDFGYSLGVLHHIPDTKSAIKSCVNYLKPGAPLLLYLYYNLENRPWWYRALWALSDIIRSFIFRLSPGKKHLITYVIAIFLYWPLARFSRLITKFGMNSSSLPLSYYQDHSFYTMQTDARDRFGTPLEQRFSRDDIHQMMNEAGLINISFADHAPYWCALGYKAEAL
jgi:SAM-dependent methyltransferase